MIRQALLYGLAFTCHCVLVSGTILSPLMKLEPGGLFKIGDRIPREYDYAIVQKRGPQEAQESPDSKERRSQMGSSFIRFGRSRYEGNLENADYSALNGDGELDSRTARGRSDVIIRFGRGETKHDRQFSRSDFSKLLDYEENRSRGKPFLGHYRHRQTERDEELERLGFLCTNLLAGNSEPSNNEPATLYVVSKLARLCNGIANSDTDDNDQINQRSRSKIILEDPQESKRD